MRFFGGGQLRKRTSRAACQFIDILPRHAARAPAAAFGPFQRIAFGIGQPVMRGVAGDDREVFVLRAIVEAEAEAEAVGKGEAIIHRIARVYRIILFGQMPFDNRATV